MTSKQVGTTIYSLMSLLHFIASIMFYFEGNALASIIQLLGSMFWIFMIQFDTTL